MDFRWRILPQTQEKVVGFIFLADLELRVGLWSGNIVLLFHKCRKLIEPIILVLKSLLLLVDVLLLELFVYIF